MDSLLSLYNDHDEEMFPAEAAKLGLVVSLESHEDYFRMMVSMYCMLDE
jgi:hypothetical protein